MINYLGYYLESLESLGTYQPLEGSDPYMAPNTRDVVVSRAEGLMDMYYLDGRSMLRIAAGLLAPFGYSVDPAHSNHFILEGDYGFKCMLLDIVSAIFRQLLPTAPALLIQSYWTDYNNNSGNFFSSFLLKSLGAVMVVWPVLIATFPLRVLSSVFVNPITYHAGRACAASFFPKEPQKVVAQSIDLYKKTECVV